MEGTSLSDQFSRLTPNETMSSPMHQPASDISPDYIRSLNMPTERFLCRLSDNWANLRFGGFRIRDMISGITLVEVQDDDIDNDSVNDTDDPSTRVIKYHLGPDFLRLRTIGLTLKFSNGD